MAIKIVAETIVVAILFLLIIVFSVKFGITITASQINWSSVTFSIGFILGSLLTIFYLKRGAVVKILKRLKRVIKRK
jgi:hypothetical protein